MRSHTLALVGVLSLVAACATDEAAVCLDDSSRLSTSDDSETEITPVDQGGPPQATQQTPAGPQSDSTRARELVEQARTANEAADYTAARSRASEAIDLLMNSPAAARDDGWVALLHLGGRSALDAQDPRTALPACELVHDLRSRSLPDDHPELQEARGNLARALADLGRLQPARALEEKLLDVYSRTVPDDDPALQKARWNHAATLSDLGDYAGARPLFESVLAVYSRTLPDHHVSLQSVRANLAGILVQMGDLAGARALVERVLEVGSTSLPADHPILRGARLSLGSILKSTGDLTGARALQEDVLDVSTRTLPPDHPDVHKARLNLALTLQALGDPTAARVQLEIVLEAFSRQLDDDDLDLQKARLALAATACWLGDLERARALQEKVLDVYSHSLPSTHREVQVAREGLAITLGALGDHAGARTLQERALAVYSSTLPQEHTDLEGARLSLAVTLKSLGDLAAARSLEEGVLRAYSRVLRNDDRHLQQARHGLAVTIAGLQASRRSVDGTFDRRQGENDADADTYAELVSAYVEGIATASRSAVLSASPREAEERCSNLGVGSALNFAAGLGVFERRTILERQAFLASEWTRGAALAASSLALRSRADARHEALRAEVRAASEELTRLAHVRSSPEEMNRARTRRETAERQLARLAVELTGHGAFVDLDLSKLAATLSDDEAMVGFRRYKRWEFAPGAARGRSMDSLCALVLTSDDHVTRVELGPIARIQEAARAWRASIGPGLNRGDRVDASMIRESAVHASALRSLIFDPLLIALEGRARVVVALDDVLHALPLDALPLEDASSPGALEGELLLGDRWRIETRATLSELLWSNTTPTSDRALLALGDPSFDFSPAASHPPETGAVSPRSAEATSRTAEQSGVLRGGPWERAFNTLPETSSEVRAIARYFESGPGAQAAQHILEREKATRDGLFELAPQARWLHVATHGWFAPESIAVWSDDSPLDVQSGLGMRMSGPEQLRGMNPMLLCGLALAGANLPVDACGRIPGLVTAEELSGLDLSGCELAVLSACDTNVGDHRAGQGIASLQKALQMAGARSVLTSLWRVPDEATRELMVDFYRRMWVEGKPKHQALWEAKTRLRNARNELGTPRYSTRDWAGWVLTGEPE